MNSEDKESETETPDVEAEAEVELATKPEAEAEVAAEPKVVAKSKVAAEAEVKSKVAASSRDEGEGQQPEKPAPEMLAALAKLQDKGADVSSANPELEEALAEDTEADAAKASDETSAETSADALTKLAEKTRDVAAITAGKVSSDKQDFSGGEKIIYVAKHDALGRAYATGKRKNSIVRVWIKPGQGKFSVNGREMEKYFARAVLCMIVKQPFEVAKCENSFDVMCTAKGGGLSGQAGALKHGISRALCNFDPQFRPALKNAGFMTRDARIVERKKYGRPKARKSFQFSKR